MFFKSHMAHSRNRMLALNSPALCLTGEIGFEVKEKRAAYGKRKRGKN